MQNGNPVGIDLLRCQELFRNHLSICQCQFNTILLQFVPKPKTFMEKIENMDTARLNSLHSQYTISNDLSVLH